MPKNILKSANLSSFGFHLVFNLWPPKGKTFKPHKHIFHSKETKIAQESWVVVRGSVKVFLYDLDDSILREEIIYPGDASITLYGGHTYEILEDDTVVYEYKTGPYMGVEKDKEFI